MPLSIYVAAAVLTHSSAAQTGADAVVEVKDAQIQEHRAWPGQAIHRTQQEIDALAARPRGFANKIGQCLFDVTVSTTGTVESLQPAANPGTVDHSDLCASHQQEAEAIQRARTYQPWLIDGMPRTVKIQDFVAIYPPERWGTAVAFPARVDRSDLEIRLDRTSCFGSCPDYAVSISGDGTVQYEGRLFVAIPGHHTAHVSAQAVTALIDRFRVANFLSALPEYEAPIEDIPTQTLTLRINGQTQSGKDHAGAEEGLPLAIQNLESAVDQTSGADRWIKGGDRAVAALRAEHGDLSTPSVENLALYRQAIIQGNEPLIETFLQAQTPAAVVIDAAAPPLCTASWKGNQALVARMLAFTPDISGTVLNRCLADAASSGNPSMVEMWLRRGADPNAPIELRGLPELGEPSGAQGAIAGAISSGNAQVVRMLLEHKATLPVRVGDQPVLSWAVGQAEDKNAAELAKLLIQAGADVNARDSLGHTPLFSCRQAPSAIKPLLQAGADIDARDKNGDTALIDGAYVEAAVRELLADGADPDAVANNGDTAAKRAAHTYNCKPCAALLDAASKKKKQ
jgi:hypothetical protein